MHGKLFKLGNGEIIRAEEFEILDSNALQREVDNKTFELTALNQLINNSTTIIIPGNQAESAQNDATAAPAVLPPQEATPQPAVQAEVIADALPAPNPSVAANPLPDAQVAAEPAPGPQITSLG